MLLKKIGSIFSGNDAKYIAFEDDFPEFTPADYLSRNCGTDPFRSKFWQASIQEWMNKLAEPLRPHKLVEQYPRIAAKLMTHWLEQSPLEDYLVSLVTDKREGRQGFPQPIAAELLRLHAFIVKRDFKPSLDSDVTDQACFPQEAVKTT